MKQVFLILFVYVTVTPSFTLPGRISGIENQKIKTAALQISVIPKDAAVTLEGSGKLYKVNILNTVIKMPAGTYILKVKKKGFQTYSEKLELSENKIIKRNIKLSRINSSIEYRQISRRSRGFDIKPFLKSMIVPGWGQISSGQKRGWFYLASFIGASGWYYSEHSRHSRNLDKYNNAKENFDADPTVNNALLVNGSVKKTDLSYEKRLTALYVLGSIYAINLCDALFFSSNKAVHNYSIKPYVSILNTDAYSCQPLFCLTINW